MWKIRERCVFWNLSLHYRVLWISDRSAKFSGVEQ